ncbi:hypothetical protein [Oryza sativa Japonica Group]|uniref:Uncharacterized protein n=1 Tax=Oryza sativa subsp. japonica TaxID=39947 RepID=Q5ZDU2_ORYSJ|nr:hypothetical protein [Oryza sativa Japonica Group]
MGPESSELPYWPMKFWAAHRVTNNGRRERYMEQYYTLLLFSLASYGYRVGKAGQTLQSR